MYWAGKTGVKLRLGPPIERRLNFFSFFFKSDKNKIKGNRPFEKKLNYGYKKERDLLLFKCIMVID